MTQKFENTWVTNVLDEQELKQYAEFEKDLKTRFSADQKELFEKQWAALLSEIEANLDHDPTSPLGIEIGQRCMTMMDGLYTKEHLNLRTKIWKEGFKKGKGGTEHGITPAIITWLDKAVNTYWRQRIYKLLSQITTIPKEQSLQQWNALMDEMYGDDQLSKNELLDIALKDDDVHQAAKQWLKEIKGR